MTAMTGNKDYNAGWALRHQQQWLLVQCRQSRWWLQLLGQQRSWQQARTEVRGRGCGAWRVAVVVAAAGVATTGVDNNQQKAAVGVAKTADVVAARAEVALAATAMAAAAVEAVAVAAAEMAVTQW
jgi:hypothetical protein